MQDHGLWLSGYPVKACLSLSCFRERHRRVQSTRQHRSSEISEFPATRQRRSSESSEFPATGQRRPSEVSALFPETKQRRPLESSEFPATTRQRRSSEIWESPATRSRSNSVQLANLGARSRSAATLPTRLPESKLEPLDETGGFYRRGRSNSVLNKMPQSPFVKKAPKQQGAEPPPENRTRAASASVTTGARQQNGLPSRSTKSLYSPGRSSDQSPGSPPPPTGNFFDFDEESMSEDVLTEAPEKLVKQLRQQAKERMR